MVFYLLHKLKNETLRSRKQYAIFDTWIRGFAFNISYCTSIQVELWAAIMGLEISWNMGIKS
jgi:hypothetical protein